MATQTLPMALPNQGVVATNVIAGGIAGMCEALACHPLDTIKVNMQLSKQPVQQRTVVSNLLITASTIISNEGVTGLYRGLGVVMGGIVPKMAIRFTSYECYKQMLTNKDSLQISRQGTFIAGLAAGVTEAVSVVNPVEVVKIRLQAQNAQLRVSPQIPTSLKQQNSTLHTVVTIMRVEGISSLYRGVVLTALRQGTNQAANFTVYNELKMLLTQDRDSRMLHKHRNSTNTSTTSEIPPYQTTIIGLIAGAVGPFFNAPIDTIKTRLQQSTVVSRGSSLGQVFRITSETVQQEGFGALYKGITPRVMRVAPGQAVTFTVYEFVKSKISCQ